MNKSMKAIFIAFILFSGQLSAGPMVYDCEFKHEKVLTRDGNLKTHDWLYQGDKFKIERLSGII